MGKLNVVIRLRNQSKSETLWIRKEQSRIKEKIAVPSNIIVEKTTF